MGYALNINGVYPLGKGEVDSSILSGSTTKSPYIAGFRRTTLHLYSAATGRTPRERADAMCGKSVYCVPEAFAPLEA